MSVISEIRVLLIDNAYIKGLLYREFGDTQFQTIEFSKIGSIFKLTFNHSKSPFPLSVCIDFKGHLKDIQSDEDLTIEIEYK